VKEGSTRDFVEKFLKNWMSKRELKEWRVVPYLTIWGVWLARNSLIFEEKDIPSFHVAQQIRSMDMAYRVLVI
jgi:hypothetical protein